MGLDSLFLSQVYRMTGNSIFWGTLGTWLGSNFHLNSREHGFLHALQLLIYALVWIIKKDRTSNPWTLYLFTFCMGISTSPFFSNFLEKGQVELIIAALFSSFLLVWGLAEFINQTGTDYTEKKGTVLATVGIFISTGFARIFGAYPTHWISYYAGGLALLIAYIMYDISRIHHEHDRSDAVGAAFSLYFDFLTPAIQILKMLR
jgi:FtsH-binding integral membrane protein